MEMKALVVASMVDNDPSGSLTVLCGMKFSAWLHAESKFM